MGLLIEPYQAILLGVGIALFLWYSFRKGGNPWRYGAAGQANIG